MKKEWRKKHWEELKKLAGQWIAYQPNGEILYADKNVENVIDKMVGVSTDEYVIHFIHPFDVMEYAPARFLSIRFKSFRKHIWLPLYDVKVKVKDKIVPISMLVDSGADFSLINHSIGKKLGFEQTTGEIVEIGESVGNKVYYLLRKATFIIDEHEIETTLAWMLNAEDDDLLLGRETVFDLFDIEFKQADEEIIFKWRENKI